MKILLVNKFHYRKGGAETVYFDTADIFAKQGNDVHFFKTKNKENVECGDKKYFIKYRDYSKGHGFFKNIVPGDNIKTGRLSNDEWNAVNEAAADLGKLPVYIDDTSMIKIPEIFSKCRRLQAEHGRC